MAGFVELNVLNEWIALAMKGGQIGWWSRNLRDETVVWSEELEGLFGFERGEFKGQRAQLLDLIHPDDREDYQQAVEQAIETGSEFVYDFRFLHRSGEWRWMEGRGRAHYDEEGPAMLFGIGIDITERKRVEIALRESEAVNHSIMEASADVIKVLDLDGILFYINRRGIELIELDDAESVLGKPWWEIYPKDEHPDMQRSIERVKAGQAHRFQALRTSARGTPRWWDVQVTPVYGIEDQITEILIVSRDITEARMAEEALREADKRKDEFLATLAHELRNPLAPIRYAVDLMKSSGEIPEQMAWIRDVIDRQVSQMGRLLDDLLDVGRVTQNRLQLRRETLQLGEVVESALEGTRPLMEANQHALVIDLPKEPILIEGDKTRLAQVFLNLLNNAAKYTEAKGRIELSARSKGDVVEVVVKDNGIGIRPSSLPRVFEMFSQEDSALERSQGGLGIGLSLVKGLVELHGGKVRAQSAGLGKGSAFTVTLPMVAGSAGPETEKESTVLNLPKPLRVVVVDDNVDSAVILAHIVTELKCEVETAHDGPSCLEKAAEMRPDVVLLDIGLPCMNGYEVARAIRSEPWGKGVFLAALTGWGQEEDRRKTKEAGFDEHLVKPVGLTELSHLFEELSERSRGA
ncbi:MAG: PAS domain S-box protein [Armatimonadetes bacterium]|nr:PAS domain S-box protein [Armatimonadota bacterium]